MDSNTVRKTKPAWEQLYCYDKSPRVHFKFNTASHFWSSNITESRVKVNTKLRYKERTKFHLSENYQGILKPISIDTDCMTHAVSSAIRLNRHTSEKAKCLNSV